MTKDRDIFSEIHTQSADVKNREIYLHPYRDAGEEDPGVDYRMAINFIKNIRYLDSLGNNPIRVNMQSIGGDWGAGWGIYDAIKQCESFVTMYAYGQAESMSSIILQAADERFMMPNSYFMCHFGSSCVASDVLSNQNWATIERKMVDRMVACYAERCHVSGQFFKDKGYSLSQTKSYIKRKLKDGDWYMSADEAVHYGFADGISQ